MSAPDQLRELISATEALRRALTELDRVVDAYSARPAAPAPPAAVPARSRGPRVERDVIARLHAAGFTDNEVAAALGIAPRTALNARYGLRLPINRGVPGQVRQVPAELLGPEARAPIAEPASKVIVTTIDTVVHFLRERGVYLQEHEPGRRWKVNGRHVYDRNGLLAMANSKRGLMNLPPYGWERA